MEGYCLKDKRKVEMVDPQPITMKNGKPATVGTCPICGTKIYRIGKSTAPVEDRVRVPVDREWIQQGRWESV